MRRNATFWRNVAVVGLVHAGALLGLTRWTSGSKAPRPSQVMWLDAGAAGTTLASLPQPTPSEVATTPEEREEADATVPQQSANETAMPSDLPVPTPAVTPSVTPRPTPSAAPSATPKRALKPSPTPSPKPSSKKALLAKASAAKKQTSDRAPERKKITVRPSEKNEAPPGESSSVSAAGTAASAAAVRAQVVTYARLLHDRFYAEWSQPTGLPAGARYTLSVKVRIERDGRISEFKLARSSGNVVVDESVEAAGKRVTQVEALPRELAASGHYDLNVNFELDAD